MRTITIDEVNAALDRIVQRKGDFVYPTQTQDCVYSQPRRGSDPLRCVVGELVIAELSLATDEDFTQGGRLADSNYDVNAKALCEELAHQKIATFPSEAMKLLEQVQLNQDRGASWRDAVEGARIHLADEQVEVDA